MREIDLHKTNDCNEIIRITAMGEPNRGGEHDTYHIVQDGTKAVGGGPAAPAFFYALKFQSGPIKEVGVNGITNEVLLAILIDRLSAFQRGPFACEENKIALSACTDALNILHERTQKRIQRGVEGTHEV